MRIVRSVSLAAAVVALAAPVLSASDNSTTAKDVSVSRTAPKAETGQFAALKNLKAVPMSSSELKAVKGQHFHFVTEAGKLLLVNVQKGLDEFSPTPNPDPSDTPPFIVGKGYRGLCDAALNSPGLFIPGQNEVTGVGGGC